MSTVSIYSGTVPNRQSQTQPQFDAAMDDTLAWLLAAPSEYNTVAGEVNANKIAAASSANAANAAKVAAQAAQTAAQNAHQGALDVLDEMNVVKQEVITDATNAGVAAAGAPRYPSGSPYALGACCSGSDGHTYRSIISNNSSNPVTNPGNWTKLTGLNAFVESVVNDFGTAALSDASEFATAAQGAKADSALQPSAIGVTVCSQTDSRLTNARAPTAHTHPSSAISDSTTAGRALLTAASEAAQRASLGLGSAATATVTTSKTDDTTGRLLKVGDFGLGDVAISATSNADGFYDTIVTNGIWSSNVSNTLRLGGPIAALGVLISETSGASYSAQRFIGTSHEGIGREWVRARTNGEWRPWVEILTRNTILGTVSQSAGSPTGAIIERGSNANGEYVRFADGTQICTSYYTGTVAITNISGSLYYSDGIDLIYPASFVSAPVVVVTGVRAATATPYPMAGTRGITSSQAIVNLMWGSSTTASCGFNATAIGRWF